MIPAVWNVPGSQMKDFTLRFLLTPAEAKMEIQLRSSLFQGKIRLNLWYGGEVGVKFGSSWG